MKLKCMELDGENHTVVDTEKAQRMWTPERDWDGRNWIYRPTGSQWVRETLYLSAKGRYYIVTESAYEGVLPTARFVTPEHAARWLTLNDYKLPDELSELDATE